MRPPLLKVALWTSSVGLVWFVARQLFNRRGHAIDAGAVSDEWLSQQRWAPADPLTF